MLRPHVAASQSTGYSSYYYCCCYYYYKPACAVSCTPPAPDWLWSEHRRILSTVLAEIQALSCHTFTLDAAASDSGDDTHCAEFCSPSKSLLAQPRTGHIWINVPFTQLTALLLHSKQLSPDNTSACILVPGYLPVLKPLLSGMRLLKHFTKGAAIFDQCARSGHSSTSPGVHWPVYVYTDVPSAAHAACDQGMPLHGLHSATVMSANACPEPPDERLAIL